MLNLRHGIPTAHNPFQPQGRPWCHICKDETDTDVDSRHTGDVFAYREICRRCKSVVASGTYNIPLIQATKHEFIVPLWAAGGTVEMDLNGKV